MTKENENLNIIPTTTPTREFTASSSKSNKVITEEAEVLNLKNKVAEKSKNESFLAFEKMDKWIKSNYKSVLICPAMIKEIEGFSELRNFGHAMEWMVDFPLREIVPFYGSFTKSTREKSLEAIVQYYQNQFSQLTNSFTNDQKAVFVEVTSILREKNNKIRQMIKTIEELKEQVEAEREEREKQKKEDEKAKEVVEKEKGEIQKVLQSAEKSEIEQLKAERNQLRTTTEEQEAFLNRLFSEYEVLEAKRKVTVKELELIFLDFKQRGRDLEQLRSDKIALRADNVGLKEQVKNLSDDKKRLDGEARELRSDKITLEAQVIDLEADKNQLETDLKNQIQQKRLGNLFAAGVFITDYLPIPEKWQTSIKTGFNTAQAWQIATDIPQATYEVIIGFTAILVFLGAKGIWRRIFGRKEINKIAELRGELTDALRQKNKFEAEIKELKEAKAEPTPQSLPEIITEEKPAKSKNSKVKNPKKNKEKK